MQSFKLQGFQGVVDLRTLASRAIRGFCHYAGTGLGGGAGAVVRGVNGNSSLVIAVISVHATDPVVTTATEHGLAIGDTVFIFGSDSTPIIDGAFIVDTVPSATTFTIKFTTTVVGAAGDIWIGNKITTFGGAAVTGITIVFPQGFSFGPFKFVTARHTNIVAATDVFYEEISQAVPI